MPVSSLLERMRKKLQEKATATGGGASRHATAEATNGSSANTGDEHGISTSNSSHSGGGNRNNSHGSSTSMLQRAEPAMPLPPPVFASPSSARLDYRDVAHDPLCVPFTTDMAAPILAQVLQLSSQNTVEQSDATSSAEGTSTDKRSVAPEFAVVPKEIRSTQSCTSVVDKAVRHLREFLHVANGDPQTGMMEPHHNMVEGAASREKADGPFSTTAAAAKSIYDDMTYARACALGRMDVSGAVRPVCRDVKYYTRVGRISQGVYGVVFRAITTEDVSDAEPKGTSSPITSVTQRKFYALKHIKKMWLEDSQVGFPPYLLREIDLLLRLKHPNVMGARELVLLDPTPLPQSLQTVKASTGLSLATRSSRRSREDEDAMKEYSSDSSSPPHSKPKKDSLAAATSDSNNKNSVAATATAAPRPLAAVGAVGETKDVFLVMDFCPFDLTTYMRRYHTTPTGQIPYFHITSRNAHPGAFANYLARAKSIACQLFRAVAFMHANRVMHRDLKTSNVLLDDNGYVKVCDFGLGRLYREGQMLTPTVVTLMYRAPELHLGVTDYSHEMDVWSLGCILAELFLRRPLFQASTDSHHLLAVCDVLGIPTEETFPGLYHLPQTKTMMQSLPRWNRVPRLAELFKPGATMSTSSHGDVPVAAEATLLPAEGLELLQSILQWNPRRRPSAEEVLRHPFFRTEPLPCAPEELMRPIPWKDAAPPSATTQGSPPPIAVVPITAMTSTGAACTTTAVQANEGGKTKVSTHSTDIVMQEAEVEMRAVDAEENTTKGSLAAEMGDPFAGGKPMDLNVKGKLRENNTESPGKCPWQLEKHDLDEDRDAEAEREVRLAQMKSNQDIDDAGDA